MKAIFNPTTVLKQEKVSSGFIFDLKGNVLSSDNIEFKNQLAATSLYMLRLAKEFVIKSKMGSLVDFSLTTKDGIIQFKSINDQHILCSLKKNE